MQVAVTAATSSDTISGSSNGERFLQNDTVVPTKTENVTLEASKSNHTPTTTASATDETTTSAPASSSSSSSPGNLPSSVDIVECRRHLAVADTDRNNLLNQEEYVKFVHQIVTHDFNHSMVNLPLSEQHKDIWGNTLEALPVAMQDNYHSLSQGGLIGIFGYKTDQIPKPTLAQELFLVKVCVHTEIAVYQVLQQEHGDATTPQTTTTPPPEVKVLVVYSSFELSNPFGITSQNIEPETNQDRKRLELAYQILVTRVVSDKVGITLSLPVATAKTTITKSGAASTASSTGREATRHRRFLTVALDPELPKIYKFQDKKCSGTLPNVTSTSLQKEWCQIGYGQFILYLVEEDLETVFADYSRAVQDATDNGALQQALDDVVAASDAAAGTATTTTTMQVHVTGAGPSIIPPDPTPAPTRPPHPAPTSSPHNITVPEDELTEEEAPASASSTTLIFILAGVLLLVNCCIIGISVWSCWRNRHDPDFVDPFADDGVDGFNDAAFTPKSTKKSPRTSTTNRKSNSNRNRKVSFKDEKMTEGKHRSSNRSAGSSSYEDEELISNPPTLEDIEEANSWPAPTPAPAPAPIPLMRNDAQERERILAGQGGSNLSNRSTDAPPTREEIQAALSQSAATTTSRTAGGGGPLAPPSNNAGAGYDDDDDERLPVSSGEMA